MSLSDNHQEELSKYLGYFHKKRNELEHEIDTIQEEFIESNLQEDLYNKADVNNPLLRLSNWSRNSPIRSKLTSRRI